MKSSQYWSILKTHPKRMEGFKLFYNIKIEGLWQFGSQKSNLRVSAESMAVFKKADQDTTEEIMGLKSRRIPCFCNQHNLVSNEVP